MDVFNFTLRIVGSGFICLYMLGFLLLTIGKERYVVRPSDTTNKVLAGIIVALITFAAIKGLWA